MKGQASKRMKSDSGWCWMSHGDAVAGGNSGVLGEGGGVVLMEQMTRRCQQRMAERVKGSLSVHPSEGEGSP